MAGIERVKIWLRVLTLLLGSGRPKAKRAPSRVISPRSCAAYGSTSRASGQERQRTRTDVE